MEKQEKKLLDVTKVIFKMHLEFPTVRLVIPSIFDADLVYVM